MRMSRRNCRELALLVAALALLLNAVAKAHGGDDWKSGRTATVKVPSELIDADQPAKWPVVAAGIVHSRQLDADADAVASVETSEVASTGADPGVTTEPAEAPQATPALPPPAATPVPPAPASPRVTHMVTVGTMDLAVALDEVLGKLKNATLVEFESSEGNQTMMLVISLDPAQVAALQNWNSSSSGHNLRSPAPATTDPARPDCGSHDVAGSVGTLHSVEVQEASNSKPQLVTRRLMKLKYQMHPYSMLPFH
ncbi:TPA: hypothetical protein N0F65_002873, partial [Lagenidium giganteum]